MTLSNVIMQISLFPKAPNAQEYLTFYAPLLSWGDSFVLPSLIVAIWARGIPLCKVRNSLEQPNVSRELPCLANRPKAIYHLEIFHLLFKRVEIYFKKGHTSPEGCQGRTKKNKDYLQCSGAKKLMC